MVLEQIECVLRRDEWINLYQNIWIIVGFDVKQWLMKVEVIDKNFIEFSQYFFDGIVDVVCIKCFEVFIDFGVMMDFVFFMFLFYVLFIDWLLYVCNKFIYVVFRGVVVIVFGEYIVVIKKELVFEEDVDFFFLVQDSVQEIEVWQEMFV